MKEYVKAIKNYTNFKGRSSRRDYWMFFLMSTLFAITCAILDNVLGITINMSTAYGEQSGLYGYIYFLYGIFAFLPNLAAVVRRLHDAGKSGWMFLVILIPLAGPIWLIVLLCTDSDPNMNKWGPNLNTPLQFDSF